MFSNALSSATKRALGVGRRVDGLAHQIPIPAPTPPPSPVHGAAAAPIPIPTPTAIWKRTISASPPLKSSSDDDEGESEGGKKNKALSDEKLAIARRWMKWNTSKTWRYEPNRALIAKIGKEGTTSPLDQFRDLVPLEKRNSEIVGRSWSARELRRKSYDDLHKLWLVLYKEKNMLLTESNLSRRHGYEMVQPERRHKVRKSMGAIKHVLGERKRKKIAEHRGYLEKLEQVEGLMAKMSKVRLEGGGVEDALDTEAEKWNAKEL